MFYGAGRDGISREGRKEKQPLPVFSVASRREQGKKKGRKKEKKESVLKSSCIWYSDDSRKATTVGKPSVVLCELTRPRLHFSSCTTHAGMHTEAWTNREPMEPSTEAWAWRCLAVPADWLILFHLWLRLHSAGHGWLAGCFVRESCRRASKTRW